MLYVKSWHLCYSRDGFSIGIVKENYFRCKLLDLLSFIVHHICCYIPFPPIPIFHKGDEFNGCQKKRHFHSSWSQFGWTIESWLCYNVESKLESVSEYVLSVPLDTQQVDALYKKYRSEQKFIDDCRRRDKEYIDYLKEVTDEEK